MKATTAYMLIWFAVAFAVSIGVIMTKSLIPFWAFLIPAAIHMKD